jgi:hypothetical protein
VPGFCRLKIGVYDEEVARGDYLADLKPVISRRVTKWVRKGFVPRDRAVNFPEGISDVMRTP